MTQRDAPDLPEVPSPPPLPAVRAPEAQRSSTTTGQLATSAVSVAASRASATVPVGAGAAAMTMASKAHRIAPDVFSMLQGESGRHGVEYRFHSEGATRARWRVRSVALTEHLSQSYEVRVELGSEHGDDAAELLGHPCTLTLLRDDAERYVQGIVSRVSRGDVQREIEVVELTIVPALEALAHRTDTRIFQMKTIPEVIDAVLSAGLAPYQRRHELKLQRSPYPRREYIVQLRESDLAFVQRLMAEEGLWYYFRHPAGEGKPEVLVVADGNEAAPGASLGRAGQHLTLTLSRQGNLDRESVTRFVRADALGSTSVTVHAYNWTTPPVVEKKAAPSDELGDRPRYEPDDLTSWAYAAPKFGKFDTAEQARIRWEGRKAESVRAAGTSNVIGLCPGLVVTVQGHPAGLNGDWLVTSVDAKGAYLRDDPNAKGGESDYGNTFTCIPNDTVYRPAHLPKPRVHGIQTGLVVGADGKPEIPSSGDDIHTDEHGRVQVKLSWDRTDPSAADATETCWLRVAQLWGGHGWGFMFIPRIGMEVIVGFVDGDPDRPLVTGCVYNGLRRPHYELPAEKTKSYIMTQSTPNGDGSNELRFEDAKGSEEIYVHAQKDYNEVVEHDHTTTVHANQTDTVDANQTLSVGGNRNKAVTGDETVTVKKTRTATVHGNETLKVVDGSSRTTEVSGDETKKITKTRTLEVTSVTTETYTGGRTATVKAYDQLNVLAGAKKDDHVTGEYNIKADTHFKVNKAANELLLHDAMVGSFADHIELKVGGNSIKISNDGKIALTAGSEISLACGAASLVLKADGTLEGRGAMKASLGSSGSAFVAEPAGATVSGPKIASTAVGVHEIAGALIKIG